MNLTYRCSSTPPTSHTRASTTSHSRMLFLFLYATMPNIFVQNLRSHSSATTNHILKCLVNYQPELRHAHRELDDVRRVRRDPAQPAAAQHTSSQRMHYVLQQALLAGERRVLLSVVLGAKHAPDQPEFDIRGVEHDSV